jgi:rod shape-determining protein MreD
MISFLGVSAVIVAGVVAQLLTPGIAFLAGAKVPYLLAVVVYYALTRPWSVSLMIALWAGLMIDVLSPVPLGYSSACFAGVAFAVGCFRNLVFDDTMITPAFFGGVASLVVTTVIYVLLVNWGDYAPPATGWIIVKTIATAAVGSLVTPLVFVVARSMDHVLWGLKRRPL